MPQCIRSDVIHDTYHSIHGITQESRFSTQVFLMQNKMKGHQVVWIWQFSS